MSWQDNYTRDLQITTGDGVLYTLHTLPSFGKEIEYNATEFNFVNIDLPLIKKTTIQKNEVPIEFFFINDDHIEETKTFLESAKNPNPWKIQHPYYDEIICQVTSIKFDDADGNVTKVNFTAKQIIDERSITAPGTFGVLASNADAIILKSVSINDLLSTTDTDLTPTITDLHAVQAMTTKNYKNSVKIITNPIDSVDYFNAFNTASSYINTLTATPLAAINALTAIISLPAQFASSVQNRIITLLDAMTNLHNTVFGLSTVTQKKLFFIQSAATMSAITAAAVQPATGDYTNANVAVVIAGQIKDTFTIFLSDIDTIQGANGGNPLSYFPPFDVMIALNQLVNTTVSNLFDIALAGRKEFLYVLPENSDYLLLTHKFYGLDINDNYIYEFINNNGLTYNQLPLGVPKGTTVVYYA